MTIADIAKLAGVSTATVSRVINNHPCVSSKMAHSVREAMITLEYVPSPPERRRGRRTSATPPGEVQARTALFALLVPESRAAFYPSLLAGFSNAAARTGRKVSIHETENSVERQAEIILQLVKNKVAGVALVPTTMNIPPVHQMLLRYLQKEEVPLVMLHRGIEGVKAPLVGLPFEEIGYRAGRSLVEKGHRRIAYFSLSSWVVKPGHVAGIRRALEAVDATLPEESIHYCGITQEKDVPAQLPVVESTLRQLLAQPFEQRPTAIVCSFDYLAECVLDLLRRWGVSVPGDMSIVSFGGALRTNILSEQLSAVTVDERLVGERAVDVLGKMVKGSLPIESEDTSIMDLGFHEGSTIAAPPAADRSRFIPS